MGRKIILSALVFVTLAFLSGTLFALNSKATFKGTYSGTKGKGVVKGTLSMTKTSGTETLDEGTVKGKMSVTFLDKTINITLSGTYSTTFESVSDEVSGTTDGTYVGDGNIAGTWTITYNGIPPHLTWKASFSGDEKGTASGTITLEYQPTQ
ncbi:hypothetical protein ES703_62434 [subsurface metagenome]